MFYHDRDRSVNTHVRTQAGAIVDMDTLASRLARARNIRELSQPALAKAAGVSQGTIGNIETGARMGGPSLPAIARALSVSYWWLRDGTGEMGPWYRTTRTRFTPADACRFGCVVPYHTVLQRLR